MILELAIILACSHVVMTIAWLQQKRSKNATCVDLYWTLLVTVTGLSSLFMGTGELTARLLAAGMLVFWGARLGWHLYKRLDEPEDGRYADLRATLGDKTDTWLFWFLQFQAITVPIFALPHLLIADSPETSPLLLASACVLFFISWLGQTQADTQLARFRRNPENAGRVCREGWWAYSRHPNYFFEWTISLSIALLALTHPLFLLAAIQPFIEWILLRYLTGIPPIETRSVKRKGDLYRTYQTEVSAFFPLPPKTKTQELAS